MYIVIITRLFYYIPPFLPHAEPSFEWTWPQCLVSSHHLPELIIVTELLLN